MIDALETYLHEIRDVRSSGAGVRETSYYPALINLLNEAGKALRPRVRCISQLANRGAGSPDIGLFTPDQFQRAGEAAPSPGQVPARGVVEVKGTDDDALRTAEGEQVTRYWGHYGQVLVTNLRDFVLVGQDSEGNPARLEAYRLAESEVQFWAAAAAPRASAQKHGERFGEFLLRVLTHSAPLAAPRDVAWHLASYAREALARVEGGDLNALSSVRSALEEALGLRFDGDKGEHFFRSTLVQTLFYGVFSAWVLWCKQRPGSAHAADRFRWKETSWSLHVPMIRALFDQVATPSRLGPLGLVEVLDWTESALNRVTRAVFFERFEEQHAVQYFYEPFLEAFDPGLRKQLGVWYTPPEVVDYMVEKVDLILRTQLGLEEGLADRRVFVLDPCAGTGSFLLQVLRRIEHTLEERGADSLVGHDVKTAAMERVFGFEIMPAPFVVAHLQLGLMLQNLGTPFLAAKNERAAVFLTNALTGWEPGTDPKQPLGFPFPELEAERDAAEHVKRHAPILVVIGNPPYNAYTGVSPKEENGLIDAYKDGLISRWGIKKFNLDDLYTRFFRVAERRITEKTGEGVLCLITNFSFLKGDSFVVMRERLVNEFDAIWIDNLNGDSRETGKLTPEGLPDPSIFSTPQNREGIRVGTAITTMVRTKSNQTRPATVSYREYWGSQKRGLLLTGETPYRPVKPVETYRYRFKPLSVNDDYASWPSLPSLAELVSLGILENRKDALIDIDRPKLESRMKRYLDPAVDWETLRLLTNGLTRDAARFDAKAARSRLLAREAFQEKALHRVYVRPFDTRWCYYTSTRPLWNEPRPAYAVNATNDGAALVSRNRPAAREEGLPVSFTSSVGVQHAFHKDAYYFPFRLSSQTTTANKARQEPLIPLASTTRANLSPRARSYLAKLEVSDPDNDASVSELIWLHALAVGFAPSYLRENAEGLEVDWPRVPLPKSVDLLRHSARLGSLVSKLLDTEAVVTGVTTGQTRPELALIGSVTGTDGRPLDPAAGDLVLAAGWGARGNDGAIMPGHGRIVRREYTDSEVQALSHAMGLTWESVRSLLGDTTFDVYLNSKAYWRNIPQKVWDFTIGGYQRSIKKWLSYREYVLLERSLRSEEAREVTSFARRIAAILLLAPSLDANYQELKQDTYAW